MDGKKIYDIVMAAERQENLMLIDQNNSEREQHGNKDYLSVAAESCEKFNSEFEGTIDAFGKSSCEGIINDKTPFPEGVYEPAEPGAVKVKKR